VTDGEAGVGPAIMEQVQRAKARHGLHVYVIGVGYAARKLASLTQVASETIHVSALDHGDHVRVAPVIGLDHD
jgi:hypothetical protein